MSQFPPKKFTLTEEHVALLRASVTRWDDSEFGAAAIDSKRPYGNSDVINDVHRVLTGEDLYGETERLTAEQREHYAAVHAETETALEVVLRCGTFEPGDFEAGRYSSKWERVR